MSDFTEQRFDYSLGRADAPELIVMVGVSGSGKSVIAKSWIIWSYLRYLDRNLRW
jgi:ABC-type glutathione transport system ATPase component